MEVSFETAKFAREKGFKHVPVTYAYDVCGEKYHRDYIPHCYNVRGLLSAPTQSQLQEWLRTECKIVVLVGYLPTPLKEYKKWNWEIDYSDSLHDRIVSTGFKHQSKSNWIPSFNTYEEALEAGLIEALKLI